MSYTTTTRLALKKAVIGSNQPFETAEVNANWDKVDAEAVAADVRLDVIEALNGAQDGRLSAAEGRLTAVEGVNTTQNGRLDAAEANITALGATTSVRTVSGTSDTLLTADKNNIVRYTSATAVAVTVPDILTAGQRIDILQDGAGQLTISGSGITIVGTGSKTVTQYAAATVLCIASGQYRLVGNITV